MSEIESDGSAFEILDQNGKLKKTGWFKRDDNVIFNHEVIKKDESYPFLKELTKIRHLTLIVDFSKKKVSIYRLFDFGLNCVAVTTHILKANEEADDALQAMADDMTTKEPHGIVFSDTKSVGVQPFNVSSQHENIKFTDREDFDNQKYKRVMNMKEVNTHPFNFDIDFDIFMEHDDEALTLLQN